MEQADLIWHNGELVAWEDAKVHVLRHGLHYGTGAANPLAMFLSGALMLRYGLGMEEQAAAVESAVDRALSDGLRTPDLGGSASTREATQAVFKYLKEPESGAS